MAQNSLNQIVVDAASQANGNTLAGPAQNASRHGAFRAKRCTGSQTGCRGCLEKTSP